MQIELKNDELAILTLVVKGLEDSEIAQTLSIDEKEVKKILPILKEKFSAKRRIDLAICAVKMGIVD